MPDPGGTESAPGGPGPVAGPGLPGRPAGEGPAHARREWRKTGKPSAARPPRVTASVRGDIEAKIGFGLELPGRVWQARDPLCGGVFVGQVPEIARSLTAWVIRSDALVSWFTSPAGSGFMLLLDTAAAVGPVVSAVMAHHVYHSVGDEQPDGNPLQPDYGRYAA